MRIGILSDSHGRTEPVREALRLLSEGGAEAIIHCGDVGGLDVLDELSGWRCWFVWGNMDIPQTGWRRYVADLDLPWPEVPLELTLAGKRISVCHGHERAFSRVRDAAEHDYLFYGHTHKPSDHRSGGMRVINPGALHRASLKTTALLDLATDQLTFYEINGC